MKKPTIDLIAVTKGPGLEPALWVGISFAKALGELWNIPVRGINHMEGHIFSVLLDKKESSTSRVPRAKKDTKTKKEEFKIQKIEFPALALLVSGGHTELVFIKKFGSYQIIGKTRDDAVGEAFDKAARILGLSYPGGPEISKAAEKLRSLGALTPDEYRLPRPMIHSKDYDFSFSGLKTAVLYLVKKISPIDEATRDALCLEFENAAVETLIAKTKKAVRNLKIKTLIVGGGVSANTFLRKNLKDLAEEMNTTLLLPTPDMATDNAVMIGIVASLKSASKKKEIIKAEGNLSLQ